MKRESNLFHKTSSIKGNLFRNTSKSLKFRNTNDFLGNHENLITQKLSKPKVLNKRFTQDNFFQNHNKQNMNSDLNLENPLMKAKIKNLETNSGEDDNNYSSVPMRNMSRPEENYEYNDNSKQINNQNSNFYQLNEHLNEITGNINNVEFYNHQDNQYLNSNNNVVNLIKSNNLENNNFISSKTQNDFFKAKQMIKNTLINSKGIFLLLIYHVA